MKKFFAETLKADWRDFYPHSALLGRRVNDDGPDDFLATVALAVRVLFIVLSFCWARFVC
jgi:hypothetical protein